MNNPILPLLVSACMLVAASVRLDAAAGAQAEPAPISAAPESLARVLPIMDEAFAGSSINVVAGAQSTLFTARGAQYAAFYSADGTLMLARRPLGEDTWTTHATRFRGRTDDAHNTVAIAVDGDGYLHVAWDHHDSPLNYVRSVAPESLELGEREPMTGAHEQRVSYPQFLRMPEGNLLFLHRDGASGRGNLVLKRYDSRARAWSLVHANLIDGEGQRSAYPSATIDRRGVLHLAWNWRDTPDVATNHDLCYAHSKDGGRTWENSAGAAMKVPFTAANAEYALRIPKGRSLMNPPSIAVDAAGRALIVNYWTPEDSDVPQFHLVRHDGIMWRVTRITERTTAFTLAGANTKRAPISRCALLAHAAWRKPQELYLVYRDDERGGCVVLGSCLDIAAEKPAWTWRDLTANSVGAWEPSLDPEQARRLGQLHALVQNVTQRDGNDHEAADAAPTPISSLLWSPFLAGILEGEKTAATRRASTEERAAAEASRTDRPLAAADVLAVCERVADWQLAQPYPANRQPAGWEIAPFYIGALELAEISPSSRFHDAVLARAEKLEWKPAPRVYHADDYCITQAYLRLYQRHREPRMIRPSQARFDQILATPAASSMEWGVPRDTDRWTWCDALFMGPASWIGVARATGDSRYAEFAHREWRATQDALYRPEHGWFARDESFLDLREPNGKPVFWSRGNGWVVAGLTHVLQLLDEDDSERPRYVQLYHEMMRAALAAQQPDGLWRPGLLDPAAHPARETSGSSFMTFALTWGVNNGLLDRAEVEPAIRRAWHALSACVTREGKLEHVQPIGAAPEGFDPHHNDWFGAGAFLLAGTQVYRLAGGEVVE